MAEQEFPTRALPWALPGKPRRGANGSLFSSTCKNPFSAPREEGRSQETPDLNQKWRFAQFYYGLISKNFAGHY